MKFLQRFTALDLILIASFAAIGIAIKPIVGPLSKMISTPLGIPGGSFAGGLYLMWMVLAMAIIRKPNTGILFGVLQAIGVLIFGLSGNQGALSLISYTIPGLVADLVFMLLLRKVNVYSHLILCAAANVTGAILTAIFMFHHPLPIFLLTVFLAIISGLVGGYLSFGIFTSLKTLRIIK